MLKAKTIILTLLNLGLLIGLTATANAQSIDLGRGELPLTVPQNYNAETPSPLVVLLHGYTSSGPQQDSYMGFSKLAEKYGYLFIAPDGDKEPGGNESRFWNASSACCDFYNTDIDDSSYVLSIIDNIKADFNIDPNRIYLIGHSNGGFLSYRAAYDHSSTIAAIASLAGASHIDERSAPSNPVHILQIHGTADETIAYEGSEIQGNKYPSALDSVTAWAAYNGCSTEGDERELRDLDARIAGHESSVLSFKKGCQVGGSSELWTIAEGSHVPPLSSTFSEQVVEWLYAHPKTSASYSD
jgi:polyhydroxybutyrate depolymerase